MNSCRRIHAAAKHYELRKPSAILAVIKILLLKINTDFNAVTFYKFYVPVPPSKLLPPLKCAACLPFPQPVTSLLRSPIVRHRTPGLRAPCRTRRGQNRTYTLGCRDAHTHKMQKHIKMPSECVKSRVSLEPVSPGGHTLRYLGSRTLDRRASCRLTSDSETLARLRGPTSPGRGQSYIRLPTYYLYVTLIYTMPGNKPGPTMYNLYVTLGSPGPAGHTWCPEHTHPRTLAAWPVTSNKFPSYPCAGLSPLELRKQSPPGTTRRAADRDTNRNINTTLRWPPRPTHRHRDRDLATRPPEPQLRPTPRSAFGLWGTRPVGDDLLQPDKPP